MKVLVTGGAGFIGSHTVEKLLQENCQVFILDNLTTGSEKYIHKSTTFIKMDVRNSSLLEVFYRERFDCVMHFAAQTMVPQSLSDPYYDCDVNVLGMVNVLEASRKSGVRRIVFPSSAAVYGNCSDIPLTEELAATAEPMSFYALSKLTVEKYLSLYKQIFGLEYVILRYANVYGERQGDSGEGGVISIFSRKIHAGQPITIFGDGDQTRDFIYVADVATANYQALTTPACNSIYNISTATETSIKDIASLIEHAAAKTVDKVYCPSRDGDIYRSSLANSLARIKMNWQPGIQLADGLQRTYHSLFAEN